MSGKLQGCRRQHLVCDIPEHCTRGERASECLQHCGRVQTIRCCLLLDMGYHSSGPHPEPEG